LGPTVLDEEEDEEAPPPSLHLYSYCTGRQSSDALTPTFMPRYSPDWLTRHFSLVAFDEETGRVCLLDELTKRLKILDFGPIRTIDGRRELAFQFEVHSKVAPEDSENSKDSESDEERILQPGIWTESSLE